MERPKVSQEGIRDVFGVGQKVLVRSGTEWHTREILGITVFRCSICPECNMPLLGEPRFWFEDYGNVPLDQIMAKEDIDPPVTVDFPVPGELEMGMPKTRTIEEFRTQFITREGERIG